MGQCHLIDQFRCMAMTSPNTPFAFRKHTRSKTRKRVQLTNETLGEFLAVTQDISDSGLSIERKNIPSKVKVGETFNVRMAHRDEIERVKVVRDTPQTIGLTYL